MESFFRSRGYPSNSAKEMAENCRVPFLTYLCNKRLKPSLHCVQLYGKIAHIVRVLSNKMIAHICLCDPYGHAELH